VRRIKRVLPSQVNFFLRILTVCTVFNQECWFQ